MHPSPPPWESGEGRNSSGKTAVFTYRKPGVYVATLEVTDNEGATSSASVKVNVTGNSAPYFTSDSPEQRLITLPPGR
ncbi:MAG: PKD domain-containing protein [Candidatus Nanohalobium sp.]